MDRELEPELWTGGKIDGRAPNGRGFDREEHPVVLGGGLGPFVITDELCLECLKPAMGTSIGSTEGVGGCERDVCATGPVVHVCDAAGKDELGAGLHGER